jgi:hypothetical protein
MTGFRALLVIVSTATVVILAGIRRKARRVAW